MARLLLVDDEDFELRGLVSMIQSLPLPIEVCGTARNGREGLQKALELRPGVVLTDLRMPQMSGIEMLHELHGERPEAHCVLISGFEDFEAAREGLELGMLAYLLKPVGREELFRTLARCCEIATEGTLVSPQPPAAPEEEHLIRRLLRAPAERVDALLKESPVGERFLSRMIYMVISLQIQPTGLNDMFDHRAPLMRFAKANGLYAPVVLDGSRAVLVMSAPALLSEAAFIDDAARKADLLLSELTERGADGAIGLSEIGREAGQLSALYQQSLLALDRQNRAGLSRVVFYDQRGSQFSEHQVVSRIQAILEAEYKSPLSLDAIAERLFLSPSHMRRLFKNKTGATVMDYLENLRLEKSLNLLAQPQLKIHEIGMLVGYENPSYFNAVFKRRYGVTPGDYRKAGTRPCEK